jgi:hypothetical protein
MQPPAAMLHAAVSQPFLGVQTNASVLEQLPATSLHEYVLQASLAAHGLGTSGTRPTK